MITVDRALLLAKCCSLCFIPPYSIQSNPYAEGLRYIAQVEDPDTQAGATIFETTDGSETIIACRGSATIRNFRTNFNIGPSPLATPNGPHPTAKVHSGFQSASAELWRRIEPKLPNDIAKLSITGHSLGGGTATLLTLRALEAGCAAAPELVTIAGPRMGNTAFAEYFRDACPVRATHLVHEDDDVLKSNAALWDLSLIHI